MMDYTKEAILRRNKVLVKARKQRKDRWVYHYDRVGEVVAVKLYGSDKLLGKITKCASKADNPSLMWSFVQPILAFGKIDDKKTRWFNNDKLTTICRPDNKHCDNCKFRFGWLDNKMKKAEMIKCFFTKRQKQCEDCEGRFVCLTTKWTDDDREACADKIACCVLRIPNTMEGQAFYQQFKNYLNTDAYKAQRYGRATNRKEKGGNQSHTPIGSCDYFGVYLRDSDIVVWRRQKRYEDEHKTNVSR